MKWEADALASAIRRVGVKLSQYISVELRGAARRLYHDGQPAF
jgi:hypothetical protein